MDVSLVTALGLGLTLGLRHALDADHVAAVSTLVARERGLARSASSARSGGPATRSPSWAPASPSSSSSSRSPRGSRRRSSESSAWSWSSWAATCSSAPSAGSSSDGREHTHGGMPHRHAHGHLGSPDAAHVHLVRLGGRPFLVGLLHGLAGSAALTLLVLGTIPSPIGALVYILVFGVGSTAGMLLLSGLVGLPVALLAPAGRTGSRRRSRSSPASGARPSGSGCWQAPRPDTASGGQSDRR